MTQISVIGANFNAGIIVLHELCNTNGFMLSFNYGSTWSKTHHMTKNLFYIYVNIPTLSISTHYQSFFMLLFVPGLFGLYV